MRNGNSSGGGCLSIVGFFAVVVGLVTLYFWSLGMPVKDAVQVGFSYGAFTTVGLFCGLPLLFVLAVGVFIVAPVAFARVMDNRNRYRTGSNHTSFLDRLLGR